MVTNADGDTVYGVAVLRLCETEHKCKGAYGCKKHFGDIVVSLEDYVQAFFDDQADNMGWNDDKYDFEKFATCDEYEPEEALDDDSYENYKFYIGPTCSSSKTDIGLDIFTDEYCTKKSKISFNQLSNGWSLPFIGGGLISTNCVDCIEYNDDDGAYGLRDMCPDLYDASTSKCEAGMRTVSSSGSDESGCKTINKLLPKAARRNQGSVGAFFGWLFFILLIGVGVYYVMWWKKQKASNNNDVVLS